VSRSFFAINISSLPTFQAGSCERSSALMHGSPLCLAAPSSQPPKPGGSRRKARGVDGESACQADNGVGPLHCKLTALLLISLFPVDVPIAFVQLTRGGALSLCGTRCINLYPVGVSPVPRSLIHRCEGKGAPRRMGPIYKTASFSQSWLRSHIHLGSEYSFRSCLGPRLLHFQNCTCR